MTFHLDRSLNTIEFVKMDDGDIVGVLSNLSDLIFEVEIGKLCDIAGFEVIDRFIDSQDDEDRHDHDEESVVHTC